MEIVLSNYFNICNIVLQFSYIVLSFSVIHHVAKFENDCILCLTGSCPSVDDTVLSLKLRAYNLCVFNKLCMVIMSTTNKKNGNQKVWLKDNNFSGTFPQQ